MNSMNFEPIHKYINFFGLVEVYAVVMPGSCNEGAVHCLDLIMSPCSPIRAIAAL